MISGGEGNIQYSAENLCVSADDFIVINSGILHRPYSDTGFCYYFLIIDETFCLENGIDVTAFSFDKKFKSAETKRIFYNVITQMNAYEENPTPLSTVALRSAVLELLTDLCANHSTASNPNNERSSAAEKYVKQALEHINQNFNENISLESLAELCGIGKRDKTEPALKPEFSVLYGTCLTCKVHTWRRSPSPKIIRKLKLEGLRVLKEKIFRIGEINFRSNMRILQENLPKHIQIFTFQNRVRFCPSCLTKFHLAREFKKHTGQTVLSYVNTLRCQNAEHCISNGMSVTEAAYASGFSSLSYFSRTYKKKFGESPSRTRDNT